jgi:tight adherence protein B
MHDFWSTALTFLAFACGFLALASLKQPAGDRRLRGRIDCVRGVAQDPEAGREQQVTASVRRQRSRSFLGGAGEALGHLLPRTQRLHEQLEEAGIGLDVVDYLLLCLAVGGTAGAAARLVLGASAVLCVGVAVGATLGLPHLVLRHRIRRRRQEFLKQFPDAVDLVIRAVKSGLPVAEALQTVADESANQAGRLFQEVTGSMRLGKSLNEALAAVSARVDIAELRFFVISIAIQQETGGNLAEILQNLVNLMRRRTQVKLKIRAMSSEARASATIIGALPFVMAGIIPLIDPDYLLPLFADPRGWLLLAAGSASLCLGLGIMAKLVRFEI